MPLFKEGKRKIYSLIHIRLNINTGTISLSNGFFYCGCSIYPQKHGSKIKCTTPRGKTFVDLTRERDREYQRKRRKDNRIGGDTHPPSPKIVK